MKRRRLVVGLTGGIGSGKSAAAEEFARLGATIVDADRIAHDLTGPRGKAMPQIEERFGSEFVAADGGMDRERMRRQAFSNPASKAALEALLHPLIREESARLIEAARGPYVVHVVPLLVEAADYRHRVDLVLVVDCPEDLQIARVRARSGLSEHEARAIMRAQSSRSERLAAADDVLDNAGTLDALRQQVAALHVRYCRMAENIEG